MFLLRISVVYISNNIITCCVYTVLLLVKDLLLKYLASLSFYLESNNRMYCIDTII